MDKKMIQRDNTSAQPDRKKRRFVKGLANSAGAALEKIEENPDLPRNMTYFIDVMREIFSGRGHPPFLPGPEEKKAVRKVIGTYCILVPDELIYAAGAVPVRLCGGSYETSLAGDELVPKDTCPLVKASIGFAALGLTPAYEMCDVVILPTTCDAKRKMGEVLAGFKEVWMLEAPHIKESEGARRQWLEQLYGLKKNLEKYTGNKFRKRKIGRKALEASIQMVAAAQYQARRLYDLRKSPDPVILGREAMLAQNAYSYLPADRWTAAMIRLNDEL